jgi:subtilisin family serine protease
MKFVKIFVSRTLMALGMFQSVCLSDSPYHLRRDNNADRLQEHEHDRSGQTMKTTKRKAEQATTKSKRFWVHYGIGRHDDLVHSIQSLIPTLSIDFDFPHTDSVVIRTSESEIQKLLDDPEVWLIEEDAKRSPLTLLLNPKNRLKNKGITARDDEDQQHRRAQFVSQMVPYGVSLVQADLAWQAGVYGQGVTVCFIDSGLDATHPDYNSQGATGNITGDTLVVGTTWDTDCIGHGTHITGTWYCMSEAGGQFHGSSFNMVGFRFGIF